MVDRTADVDKSLRLHKASKDGDIDVMRGLLKAGVSADTPDRDGLFPIHTASASGHLKALLLLVAYHVDVNVRNPKTGMTALHYANRNNTYIIRFLLSSGADPTIANCYNQYPDTGLPYDQLRNFQQLKCHHQHGDIVTYCKLVSREDSLTIGSKHIDRKVTLAGATDKKTFLFCRRIPRECLCMCNGGMSNLKGNIDSDKVMVISDVYEYFVSDKVPKVEITVPIYKAGTKFDDLLLIDSSGKRWKATEVSQGRYASAKINLLACETLLSSFVLILESKTEQFTYSGGAQTLAFPHDTSFTIDIAEGCLPNNSVVSMKIVPTEGEALVRNADDINRSSNFHQVQTNQKLLKNTKNLRVSIPLPGDYQGPGSSNTLVVFQKQTGMSPWSAQWTKIDAAFQYDTKTATFHSMENGTCIVTELKKQYSPGIIRRVSDFLYHLYECVSRKQSYCCFFAMPKQIHNFNYRLVVGIADEELQQTYMEKLSSDGYIYNQSHVTGKYLCTHNSKYDVTLQDEAVEAVTLLGIPSLNLTYSSGRPTHQHFLVARVENTQIVTCRIQRTLVGPYDTPLVMSLYVQLTSGYTAIPEATPLDNEETAEFPSSALISELSQDMGYERIMIGLGLDIEYSFLTDFQQSGSALEINLKIIMKWKKLCNIRQDRGIVKMIQTLKLVERRDMIEFIDSSVQTFVENQSDHAFSRWVVEYTSNGHHDYPECNCSDRKPCISHFIPAEEYITPWYRSWRKYLVKLAYMLGLNKPLLLQLGCCPHDIQAVCANTQLPAAAMFNLLHTARQRFEDAVHFYQALLEILKEQQNNDMIETIIADIKKGFRDVGDGSAFKQLLDQYDK